MGRPVTLPTPPWEEARPKPPKKKRYGSGNFPRGTPWIERYWRRGLVSDDQYAAAMELVKVLPKAAGGNFASSRHRERVDGTQALGAEDLMEQAERYRKLSQAVPEQYWPYLLWVVVEDKSLWCFPGCSGGANFNRYLGRLKLGLKTYCINHLTGDTSHH